MLKRIGDKEIINSYRKSGLLRQIFGWRRIAQAQLEADQKDTEAMVQDIFGKIERGMERERCPKLWLIVQALKLKWGVRNE